MEEKKIVIIDGNSLINRAYYAMQKPMITAEGIYTQGIYGFLNMLQRLRREYAPTHLAVCWDLKGPTFRHEQYEGYKAGRKKMPMELAMEIPILKEILQAMSLASLECAGYEADDLIGTVAAKAELNDFDVLIVTGDKDALQLASKKTAVLITRKGISAFDLYDEQAVLERYGLTPQQFVDLKGLMGDSSDNLPGIPGVGEKTGIRLLKQFGSLAEILLHTDEIENKRLRQKVEDGKMQAILSRRLAEIDRRVPLPVNMDTLKIGTEDRDALISLFVRLEFHSFLKRMQENGQGTSGVSRTKDRTSDAKRTYQKFVLGIPATAEEENRVLGELEKIDPGSSAIIKVISDESHITRPRLYALALLAKDRFFFLARGKEGADDAVSKAVHIISEKELFLAGHECVRDLYVLLQEGLTAFHMVHDTALAQYVLDPSRSAYELSALYFEAFHQAVTSEKEFLKENDLEGIFASDGRGWRENGEKVVDFALSQCKAVDALRPLQEKALKETSMEDVVHRAEYPLIAVLAAMEVAGFRADAGAISAFGEDLKKDIAKTERDIYEAAGGAFNINSPKQLGEVLFERLSLPPLKKTKTGYGTSADVLEKLRDKHPIIEQVLTYRSLTKLNSTYVEGLLPLIGEDAKVRAHFRQTVAQTGRISCTQPNLQNIPVRDEHGRLLRRAFEASGEDHVLISADYSQIELRVLAHLSGDENLLDAFRSGADIHRATASRVFDIPYEEVTPSDRSRAKAVNFGVIYGMSGFGLAEELSISRKDAERYIAEYFEKHTRVKAFMDEQIRFCRENGYTQTILGRRRYIKEISSSRYMTRQLGERLAMNSPIQGSAADIIKLAMIRVYEDLQAKGLSAKLILQIHDELILDTPVAEQEDVSALLVRNMEQALPLDVKLEVSLNTGRTWYDLK